MAEGARGEHHTPTWLCCELGRDKEKVCTALSAGNARASKELFELLDQGVYLPQAQQHGGTSFILAPDSERWPNVLLSDLLISLPFTTSQIEQVFSCFKGSSFDISTLHNLSVEGPSLQNFAVNSAIDIWWKGCNTTRRPNQRKGKSINPDSLILLVIQKMKYQPQSHLFCLMSRTNGLIQLEYVHSFFFFTLTYQFHYFFLIFWLHSLIFESSVLK